MIKRLLLLLIGLQSFVANGQIIVCPENDSIFFTEFRNGREWSYVVKDGFIVGVNNQMTKNDYGSYYQMGIIIKNMTNAAYTFDPADVSAELYKNNGDTVILKVYTNEMFLKKMKKVQMWAMALQGLANGITTGLAGSQARYTTCEVGNYAYTQTVTTYNYSAVNVAQIASITQLMIMGKQMEDDRKVREEGYLKKTTIHSGEGIVGYMNIKKQKGQAMMVVIPINGVDFKFKWDVGKRSVK